MIPTFPIRSKMKFLQVKYQILQFLQIPIRKEPLQLLFCITSSTPISLKNYE
jgi:hypothetical protein